MNYRCARQLAEGPNRGRWNFTCGNDNSSRIHAEGYCAGCPPWLLDPPQKPEWMQEAMMLAERERGMPHRDKYHTDGHATQAEAEACYSDYLLDNGLSFYPDQPLDGTAEVTLSPCAECRTMTSGFGDVSGAFRAPVYLCEKHRTREIFCKTWKAPVNSWGSY